MNTATDQSGVPAAGRGFLDGPSGLGAWLTTRDHKKIGLMFLGWTTLAFTLGLLFGLMMIVKSLGGRGLEPKFIFEMATYHRVFLVFLFLIPVVPSVLGYFLLPLQLGARNLALPGMSVWSLRCYVVGLVLTLISVIGGPITTGWTLAAPLSQTDPGLFGVTALGLCLVSISWFLTGINFVVTVHHGRARGMGFFDMPILAWSQYLAGYLLTVVGVLFSIGILYLLAARIAGKGPFGEDPLVWTGYFWFVITPAAIFSLVPALGVVFEVVAGISRRAVVGYRTVVGSLIALTALGFVTGGVSLVGQGLDPIGTLVYTALGILAAAPIALVAYNLLATLNQGAVSDGAPGVFVLGFMLHAGIACVMGLFRISPSISQYLTTTMFGTVQLDYIIWGGALSALLAGLHYWWPKMTGRVYEGGVAWIGGILYIVGLNLALVPQMILGTQGVGEDMAAFVPGPGGIAEFSGLGWLIVYGGLAVVTGNLVTSLWGGTTGEPNPWGAATLEWKTTTPPSAGNFDTDVEAGKPYEY